MKRPLALIALVVGSVVATACGGDGGGESAASTSTTVVETTVTTLATTTSGPTTTAARAVRTTRTTVRATTTVRPATTVAPATTTAPALTRAAATQALCKDLEASVRLVSDGNTLAGGLRLTRAVNTYGDAADPAVTNPTRRVLSAALAGDLDSSAAAVQEAATACSRLGFPINIGVQCVTAPCP